MILTNLIDYLFRDLHHRIEDEAATQDAWTFMARLQEAVGDGVDISSHAVFEAISLNTLPIRKRHPLYTDAIHSKHFLSEMAAQVKAESLPIYLMHDFQRANPVWPCFLCRSRGHHGCVRASEPCSGLTESHADVVEGGQRNVDQVSDSVLPKSLACSECGFDFLGDSSELFDNVLSGTCDKGHIMGEDGAHAVSQNLDSWFEMSLVGRAGRGEREFYRVMSKDLGRPLFHAWLPAVSTFFQS